MTPAERDDVNRQAQLLRKVRVPIPDGLEFLGDVAKFKIGSFIPGADASRFLVDTVSLPGVRFALVWSPAQGTCLLQERGSGTEPLHCEAGPEVGAYASVNVTSEAGDRVSEAVPAATGERFQALVDLDASAARRGPGRRLSARQRRLLRWYVGTVGVNRGFPSVADLIDLDNVGLASKVALALATVGRGTPPSDAVVLAWLNQINRAAPCGAAPAIDEAKSTSEWGQASAVVQERAALLHSAYPSVLAARRRGGLGVAHAAVPTTHAKWFLSLDRTGDLIALLHPGPEARVRCASRRVTVRVRRGVPQMVLPRPGQLTAWRPASRRKVTLVAAHEARCLDQRTAEAYARACATSWATWAQHLGRRVRRWLGLDPPPEILYLKLIMPAER